MAERIQERMTTIALRAPEEGALEGIFMPVSEPNGAGAVVAPPHPQYGGSMDSPVVNELCWACAKAGVASVRFNWRGVGASTGETSGDPAQADADFAAALAHVAESVPGPVIACGYSFGAAAALRAALRHPRIERLLLVAPPPALLDAEGFRALERRALVLVGQEDGMAPLSELSALCDGAADTRIEVIPEADHFFMTGLADVARLSAAWLQA